MWCAYSRPRASSLTGTGGQRWRSVALEPTTADDVDAGYRGDWPATCTSATEVR
ncbi:transmembrane protein [Mycobacterium tuberculosis CAS/NITR204]|uniref:Transmembrane protein n=1 Tax=Mycobacterium tuberculosis CAS/NITR204 TaxID=1310114 RepID=R4MP06_MYCTX|nr:transmembrane protein [Mycobacterium tuberculosis CAS/NITR204]